MLVRIRRRKRIRGAERKHSSFALGLAALLAPSALIAFTIAFWNIAARFHWAANFFVSTGPFSHWQASADRGCCVAIRSTSVESLRHACKRGRALTLRKFMGRSLPNI